MDKDIDKIDKSIDNDNTEPNYSYTISELSRLEGMLDVYLSKLKAGSKDTVEIPGNGQAGVMSEKLAEELTEKLRLLEEKSVLLENLNDLVEQIKVVDAKMGILEDMDGDTRFIRSLVTDKLNLDFVAMYNNVLDQMNVEAIKIYRNIQAVIVEENAKQNNVLFGMDKKTDGLKRRMNHVLFFCIVSFIVSIALVIVQILPAFGIKLF